MAHHTIPWRDINLDRGIAEGAHLPDQQGYLNNLPLRIRWNASTRTWVGLLGGYDCGDFRVRSVAVIRDTNVVNVKHWLETHVEIGECLQCRAQWLFTDANTMVVCLYCNSVFVHVGNGRLVPGRVTPVLAGPATLNDELVEWLESHLPNRSRLGAYSRGYRNAIQEVLQHLKGQPTPCPTPAAPRRRIIRPEPK